MRRMWAWRGTGGERGSLPMAMLIMIVGAGLAALLVPLLLTQHQLARFDLARTGALHTAEAGVDLAVGQIRAATVTTAEGFVQGASTELPCGPLSGTAGDGATYEIAIAYFMTDPSPHADDPDWLAGYLAGGNAMSCVPGFGVHAVDAAGDDVYVPSFALITATGTVDGTTRTLTSTYIVQTTNSNIAGGTIKVWPVSGEPLYCMDAGDPEAWSVGTAVTLQPCPAGADEIGPQQMWAYNPNLTIQLTASIGDSRFQSLGNSEQGLCLGTRSDRSQQSGDPLTLQACPDDPIDLDANPPRPAQTTKPDNYRLMWSIDDQSNLVNSNASGSGHGGLRIYVATQEPGEPLVLSSGSGGVSDTSYTWIPSPAAGAGQAGAPNKQLVNFAQFGRCLDVTNQSTATGNNGGSFLILYACKQDPNPSTVAWNQKFEASPALVDAKPKTVSWRTYPGGNSADPYCLTTANGQSGYVHIERCASNASSSLHAQQQWTVYQTRDDADEAIAYRYKYTIVDKDGLCLAPSDNDDLYNNQYYKSTVKPCTGTTEQKWNADPNLTAPNLTNLQEQRGGAGGVR